HSLYFPPDGAPWKPIADVSSTVDDCYIQWPPIYLAGPAVKKARREAERDSQSGMGVPSAVPPKGNYFHLHNPAAIAKHLNATAVHRKGTTGKGIRVAMIDSGFAHTTHPFFKANNYQSTIDLAPSAINDKTDVNGHGTAQSANLFAI